MSRIIIGVALIATILCLFTPLQTETAESSSTDSYKVGIDDVIEIRVIDHPNLRTTATVSADGSITFPYLGTVYVKGKSISEIEEEIARRLSEGYIKYPVVTVSLVKSMSRKIFVYGEVGRKGVFPYEENMTVEKAMSVIGGVSREGLFGKIIIRRKLKKSSKYINIAESTLNNGFIVNAKVKNMLLQPDDILVVKRSKTFLIEGEVVNRGRVVLEKDMTVLRALLQAGGVTDEGLYGKIKVRRKKKGAPGGYIDIAEARLNEGVIENKQMEQLLLQPDDILVVERNKTFLIEGEVMKRGRFVLENNMTVLQALLQAGGVTEEGLYGRIKVRRKLETGDEYMDIAVSKLNDGAIEDKTVEHMLLQPDDILVVERSKTFLIEGEVVKRGRFVLEKDMTVLRALLQAGGVTDNGLYGMVRVRRKSEGEPGGYREIARSQLNDGRIENKEVEDIILQPDDILIVERNRTYFIYGEINSPGEYILKGDMTVFKAVTLAGGLTKWGSEGRIKVLRWSNNDSELVSIRVDIEKVIKGDASADIRLKPGDTIVVSGGIF